MKTDHLIIKQVQDTGGIFFLIYIHNTYIIEKSTTVEVYS